MTTQKKIYQVSTGDEKLSEKLRRLVTVHPNYERADHMTGFHYNRLKTLWLNSDKLIDKVIEVCDGISLDGESPATECLVTTINQYGEMILNTERANKTLYPHEKMKNVLICLIYEFVTNVNVIAINDFSGREWTCVDEISFKEWAADSKHIRFESAPVDATTILKAYQKLVPHNIKIAMTRFEHESTIMDCVLDNFIRNNSGDCLNTEPMDARCN